MIILKDNTRVILSPEQNDVLHSVLGKILANLTKVSSGRYYTDTLRIELAKDQHDALLEFFGQL